MKSINNKERMCVESPLDKVFQAASMPGNEIYRLKDNAQGGFTRTLTTKEELVQEFKAKQFQPGDENLSIRKKLGI